MEALQREVGGFAKPRAFEGSDVIGGGGHSGHSAAVDWDDITWMIEYVNGV